MTRLEALRALHAAVKDGKLPEAIFHGASSVRDHWAYNLPLGDVQRRQVFIAYHGSVDAALALLAATLPGCGWTLMDDGRARIWRKGDSRSHPSILVDWQEASTPARALLLANIAALIAEEEAK